MIIDRTQLSGEALEMIAMRFRCLGEPMRLRILQHLEEGEKTVGELVQELEANQANVSKHLKVLLEGGLLTRRAQGTAAYYSIADPMIFKLCEMVCNGVADQMKAQAKSLGLTLSTNRRSR